MKERSEQIIGQSERDNALRDFVSYQAQEAILNPALPESKKDEVLEDAIRTIQRVGERKAAYLAKQSK